MLFNCKNLSIVCLLLLFICSAVNGQTAQADAEAEQTAGGASARAIASASASNSPKDSVCLCNDEPPQPAEGEVQYTCAQQKEFGQCDADFMLGFCECTCSRCCPCNNFPPTGEAFTCLQQNEFGKCDADFMQGFCECECDRCPALEVTNGTSTTESQVVASPSPSPAPIEPATVEPSPKPTPAIDPDIIVLVGCDNGLIEIFGTNPVECESVRCAQNRQRCANRCGGLAKIDFECKDVSDGVSNAFSSSCACSSS